jgi:hypothetical protein
MRHFFFFPLPVFAFELRCVNFEKTIFAIFIVLFWVIWEVFKLRHLLQDSRRAIFYCTPLIIIFSWFSKISPPGNLSWQSFLLSYLRTYKTNHIKSKSKFKGQGWS